MAPGRGPAAARLRPRGLRLRSVDRLRAKLSYTNIAFALAPAEFTIAELRDIVSAALGYEVDATNLNRVMTRRR